MSKDQAYPDASVSQAAAKAIYQKFLDEMSVAVMNYDTDVLTSRIKLPLRVTTQTTDFLMESEEDWLLMIKRMQRSLQAMGINHYIRLANSAEFLSENYIEGTHITHTLCNSTPMIPSYENRATLSRVDGEWKLTLLETSMVNNSFPIAIPRIDTSAKPVFSKTDAEHDIRRTNSSPLKLYQEYLDKLTRSNMEDDFDAWCALCDFPHTVHMERIDEVIDGPAQIRPFFEMLKEQIVDLEIDEFRRTAHRAEFVSATQLCGYHEATLYSKGKLKLGPVSSRYILRRTGTSWRAVSITNSVKNNQFPYSIPELSDALVSLRDIQERTTRT
ncbi:hypothetical protein [uncultured Litoreibacter sp.]|uniref:hypothetical protein n=1 Tax=uncultured Litoreibacter sp. TaxID=1392394 RepID=UPI00263222E6|nr:hypothetical protein [uncultured Litoreibacter sp.]